jgi:hypothetical protein
MYNLIKYCYEDSIINQFAGIEFQLFLISSKSLVPYEDRIGCMFDTERYKKELEVFKYYKSANDDIIYNYFKNKKLSSIEDNLLEYKIIPILLANSIYKNSIYEVLKNIFIFTNNHKTVLNAIIISSAIYEYFNNDAINIDDFNNETKNRLIEYSIKDFLDKYDMEATNNYYINFEKERIKLIVNNNYFSNENISKFKCLKFIFGGIKPSKDIYKGYDIVLNNFASYILKIRKGILNPEKLKYPKDIIPDLMEYLKNTCFTHPLLGECTVIKRNDKEIIFKNKLGLYRVTI